MLALFPPLLWTTTTSLEEISISHMNHEQQQQQQSYVYKDAETSKSYLRVAPSQPQDHDHDHHRFPKSESFSGDPAMVVKKLNHNASERDRRKKMNTLYSSLRSLLPAADQTVIYSFSPLSYIYDISTLQRYPLENTIYFHGFHTLDGPSTEKPKRSSNSFPCVEVRSTTARASGGIAAKEGRTFIKLFKARRRKLSREAE